MSDLAGQVRAACERHSRAITDRGGVIPEALVADLVTLAEEHAAHAVEEAVQASRRPAAARKTTTTRETSE